MRPQHDRKPLKTGAFLWAKDILEKSEKSLYKVQAFVYIYFSKNENTNQKENTP